MSCVYGYLCRDCQKSVDYGNNTEVTLKAMFSLEREANAFLERADALDLWKPEFVSGRYGQESIEDCFRFLKTHRGHDLVIGNEYNHEVECFVLTHPQETGTQ